MRISNIENMVLNVRFPELNMNLETKVKELSQRKSERFKVKLGKILTIGAVVLFVLSYNLSADIDDFQNEVPVGISK